MNDYLSLKIKNLNFILITMIVLLHSYNIADNQYVTTVVKKIEIFFTNGLTRLAVPMFFLISGYLFFVNFQMNFSTYLNKLLKRIKSLVIPYIAFSGFCTLILIGLSYFGIRSNHFIINNFTDFINILLIKPIPYHLWFIRDLFIIVVISPIIYYLTKKIWFIYVPVIFYLWLLNYQYFIILDNETVLFFSLGSFIAIKFKSIVEIIQESKLIMMISVILWITLLFIYNTIDQRILFALISFRFSELLGIIVIWGLYDLAYKYFSKHVVYLTITKYSSYSFLIYLLHEPILTIVKKLFLSYSNSDLYLLAMYFLLPGITIIICILLAKLLRQFPKIYSVISGSR